jgi:hypothetical protein
VADTKISAATAVTTPADTDQFATNQGGASKRTTLAQIKTHPFPAGTASAGTWPKFTSGTLLTTPEDGAIEFDGTCFYGTTDAGNRGVIPVRHFIRCNVTRTLPNDTNLNAIFDSPANGRLTLETGVYRFEGQFNVTAMSATAGNALVNILGAGTAVIDSWMWHYSGLDSATATTPADEDAQLLVTGITAASAVLAQTATTMRFNFRGTFEVTTGGTLIPSIDQVTAAAAIVAIGSYFMIERIGPVDVVSVGQWD